MTSTTLKFATETATTLISNTPLTLIPGDDFRNYRAIGRLAATLEMMELAGRGYDGSLAARAYLAFDARRECLRQMIIDLSERADSYRAAAHTMEDAE
jgi:hypothetical protein